MEGQHCWLDIFAIKPGVHPDFETCIGIMVWFTSELQKIHNYRYAVDIVLQISIPVFDFASCLDVA